MSSLRLPDALESWRPWLSWFDADLAAQVGELLLRMHPWLGRFRGRRPGDAAEPDGVDDLRRRGSYERLLSSEWLLASELPDEFLRRAAGGEHLFLAPRPRAHQADSLIVALFDCGPMQLGAPRLAHLALWILLSRRAVEAGGVMRWGSLQQPGQWHEAASAADLKRLLNARTFASVRPEHWDEWMRWLDQHANGIGERWLVAHDTEAIQRATPPPSHAVQLRRSLDGESLELKLSAGAMARGLHLPLPSPRRTPELLKGRFEKEVPPDVRSLRSERFSLTVAPILSSTGAKVALMALDGHGVLVFQTVSSRRQGPKPPRREQLPVRAEPLAAAFAGKTLGMVMSRQAYPSPASHLLFWQMSGLGIQTRPSADEFNAPPGRAGLLPCVWLRNAGMQRLYVLDASGHLVLWMADSKHRARGPMLMDKNVLAMARVGDRGVVYACSDGHSVAIRALADHGREKLDHRIPYALDASAPVFLVGSTDQRSGLGACAVRSALEDSQESWLVSDVEAGEELPSLSWQVRLPAGATVAGLFKSAPTQRCALVVKSANGRDISLQTSGETELTYSTGAPIERMTVCANSGVMALTTRTRELHVFDISRRQARLVVQADVQTGDNA
ncbi:hypothetical protein [Piscinibacter terrae]|uniref:Uncharacterized protein n=1 Tax=Piscinibacter terrae TaxID=2496871 RepID=A0A3N7JML8_9BURK|nr:hypothetical protein [Albitalea terrae]RQP22489.1 hypothetical protein DZC73_22875 [Albitalea terrae]